MWPCKSIVSVGHGHIQMHSQEHDGAMTSCSAGLQALEKAFDLEADVCRAMRPVPAGCAKTLSQASRVLACCLCVTSPLARTAAPREAASSCSRAQGIYV